MRAAARGYLPTLDGWRAIAILGVMIAHGTDALFAPGAPFVNPLWHHVTRYGAKGVDLFFGISGFLICSRLIEEHEARGRISLTGFYIRRFLRILPPYFVYLAAILALGAAGTIALGRGELLSSALFVRNYWAPPAGGGWYTGHLWSLAVEEHFYLLLPGLLVLWSPSRALPRLAVLALAIAAWRVVEFRAHRLGDLLPGTSIFERTDTRLDALLWGCVLALIVARPAWRARLTAWLTTPAWLGAAVTLALVIVLSPPLAMLWQSLLIPLVLAGTVLRPDTLAGRALESAPARWIGRTSYSLYLWQSLFLVAWSVDRPFGLVQRLPLSLAAVFACASLSYYVIERPAIKLGHRRAPPTTEGRA